MKRPAFMFYPADWRSNAKLRRCSPAARGIWIDVLCLLHDAEEYGVLRWPLKDIAQAADAPLRLVKELVSKDVLKGGDNQADAFVYIPRHAGKDGEPVVLVDAVCGPVWYCSRFVRDEWVRQRRGATTQFSTENQPPNPPPKDGPNPPIGPPLGDGPSYAVSNTTSKAKQEPPTPLPGFGEFWRAYPTTVRKVNEEGCRAWWRKSRLEPRAAAIVGHVTAMRLSESWLSGYEPAPLRYLKERRYDTPVPEPRPPPLQAFSTQGKYSATLAALTGRDRPKPTETIDVDATESHPRRLG